MRQPQPSQPLRLAAGYCHQHHSFGDKSLLVPSCSTMPSETLQAAPGVCNFPPILPVEKQHPARCPPYVPPQCLHFPVLLREVEVPLRISGTHLKGSTLCSRGCWQLSVRAGWTDRLSVASWACSHLCTMHCFHQGRPELLTISMGAKSQCQLPAEPAGAAKRRLRASSKGYLKCHCHG